MKSESFKTWAQGIESLDDADPFEGLVIETDGGNSQAVAEVNKYEMKEPFCDIEFELCPDMYLSNGDTVEVAIPESELEKLARKNDGYVPKKTTQEYTIEGLPALTEDNAESDRKAEAVRKQRLKEAEEKAAKEQAEKEYKERLRQSHYKSSGGSGSWSDSYSYDDEDNIDPDDPDYEEGDEDVEIPLASDTLLDYDESNQKFQREEMTFMEFHANDEHVYLTNERGELLANADFRETAPGIFDIYHTVVLPELRGQGIAAKLVAKTVEEIHRRGGKVTATCTYAKAWMERHPQEEDSIS